jgi:hypothetical protein
MARNRIQNQLDMLQTAKELYVLAQATMSAFEGDKTSDAYTDLMMNMFNARDFMIDAYVDAAKMSKKTTASINAAFDRLRSRAKLNPVYRDEVITMIFKS